MDRSKLKLNLGIVLLAIYKGSEYMAKINKNVASKSQEGISKQIGSEFQIHMSNYKYYYDGMYEKYKLTKVIELDREMYEQFRGNLLADYPFIKDNKDNMKYDPESGTRGCILVKCKERADGVLIHSEGYNYARKSAHIQNVEKFLQDIQPQPLAYGKLTTFMEMLRDVVEQMVCVAASEADEPRWEISYDAYIDYVGENAINPNELKFMANYICRALEERPEIAVADYNEYGFKLELDWEFYNEFVQKTQQETNDMNGLSM